VRHLPLDLGDFLLMKEHYLDTDDLRVWTPGFNFSNGMQRYACRLLVFLAAFLLSPSQLNTYHTPQGGGVHWKKFASEAERLSSMGITAAWLPPPTKGSSTEGTGYDTYDRKHASFRPPPPICTNNRMD
jgi:hypothetical protein